MVLDHHSILWDNIVSQFFPFIECVAAEGWDQCAGARVLHHHNKMVFKYDPLGLFHAPMESY